MKLLTAIVAILVAGCASMGGPNMNVDQLKAAASDKNASVVCSTIMGPWGTGKVVLVNLDQRVIANGGVTADANCTISVQTTATVKPEPKP